MLVAAIEAIRQYCEAEKSITGYLINDMRFRKALPLTSSLEGVETQLHFQPEEKITSERCRINDFTFYAYLNDEWSLICQGRIKLENSQNGDFLGPDSSRQKYQELFKQKSMQCKRSVRSKTFYQNLAGYGFDFERTFQSLESIHHNGNSSASAIIRLDGWKQKIDSGVIRDHVIHPTALDGLFQLTMAALSKGSIEPIPVMLPTQVKHFWVSHDLFHRGENSELHVVADLIFKGHCEVDFTIVAMNANGEVQIVIEGWREFALSKSLQPFVFSESKDPELCYEIEWKPDWAHMNASEVIAYCEQTASSPGEIDKRQVARIELACLFSMSATLEEFGHGSLADSTQSHLRKYLHWIGNHTEKSTMDHVSKLAGMSPDIGNGAIHKEDFFGSMAQSSPEGALCVAIGQHLPEILKGDRDPVDLLFSDNLTEKFYSSPNFQRRYLRLTQYIDLLAHKNADLQILEVGAGYGAATASLLHRLSDCGQKFAPRFGKYDVTDISSVFVDTSKEKFVSYQDRMGFKVLDIESDPEAQGFPAAAYDVVICGLVLHTLGDLPAALRNIRLLLKPGGKLILLEPQKTTSVSITFCFGILPGWWHDTGEPHSDGPLLSPQAWHRALQDAGFDGAETNLLYNDNPLENDYMGIVATASDEYVLVSQESKVKTFTVFREISATQKELALEIRESLRTRDITNLIVDVHRLADHDLKDSICVVLLEMGTSFLGDMSERDFSALKYLLSGAKGVVWVTQGSEKCVPDPYSSLATGVGRTVRSENWSTRFVELALPEHTSLADISKHILSVLGSSFNSDDDAWESEFRVKDGKLCISRAVTNESLNKVIASRIVQKAPANTTLNFTQPTTLSIATPGKFDSLYFKEHSSFDPALGADEIEVQVHAVTLDRRDLTIAAGEAAGNAFGSACSGTIIRLGANVNDLRVGGKILGYAQPGLFQTRARLCVSNIMPFPDGIYLENNNFEDAAAFAAGFYPAYYAIHVAARLQEEESILICDAASLIGQAAIQLARDVRAKVFVEVQTEEQGQHLRETYRLPSENVFCRKTEPTLSSMDVMIGTPSSISSQAYTDSLKPLGRVVHLTNDTVPSELGPFGASNVQLTSVKFQAVLEHSKPTVNLMKKALRGVLDDYCSAYHIPLSFKVFGVEDTAKAFEEVQTGDFGNAIVKLSEGAIVPVRT